MRRGGKQIKVLETERRDEGGKRLEIDVSFNGKGRARFMEKEEEAPCVSRVLLFLSSRSRSL